MKARHLLCIGTVAWIVALPCAKAAVTPTAEEMAQARGWMAARFEDVPEAKTTGPFFSFIYDGKPSAELLKTWEIKRSSQKLDDWRTQHTLTYTDPKTKLELRCVGVEYRDYPTVEWALYFKNGGEKDTPILENIHAVELRLKREKDQGEFVLHHNVGTPVTPRDYGPIDTVLGPGEKLRIGAAGGRPLNTDMPYFNLEWAGQGMIIVVAWTGQWTSEWSRDKDVGLSVSSGQEKTHFKLLPGEEVRTPLVVLQFWQGGDRIRSQNIWRRWMIAHNLPRPGGKPMPPVFDGSANDLFPYHAFGAAQEIPVLLGLVRRGLKTGYWERDAGWHPCGDSWTNTGTWEPDPARYPKGLREVADAAHANGMKYIVWFEPERVVAGTWLTENHPEWILGGKKGGLLNLGDPKAWEWVVNHVDKLLVDNHIDMYRQDFNMHPLDFWRGNDAVDRQGITEIKHVMGLYAFWDELKKRHPEMEFDNCASGGTRNDLEMMRRGVPLTRSDYGGQTTGSQCETYGVASWLPFFGAGTLSTEPYAARSNMAPATNVCWDTRGETMNYDQARQFLGEWQQMVPYFWGDYYPVTPYSLEEHVWMAWQFNMPEKGEGMVQAFRRTKSDYESLRVRLQGLEPEAVYTLTNFDVPGAMEMTGKALQDEGLSVAIKSQPGAAIIIYKKKP
jgi:alpha-galactosidase